MHGREISRCKIRTRIHIVMTDGRELPEINVFPLFYDLLDRSFSLRYFRKRFPLFSRLSIVIAAYHFECGTGYFSTSITALKEVCDQGKGGFFSISGSYLVK